MEYYTSHPKPERIAVLPTRNKLASIAGVAIASLGLVVPNDANLSHQKPEFNSNAVEGELLGLNNNPRSLEDENILPTPDVIFAKYKNKKVAKKNKKTCKKLVKARDDLYDSKDLKGKDFKFLKTKCKIKYPKIQYSDKKTQINQGIIYNWGVKPVNLGGSFVKISPIYQYMYPDEVIVSTPQAYENVSDNNGNLISSRLQPDSYFVAQENVNQKKKFELTSISVAQPQPSKKKPNGTVDSQIVTEFCNYSGLDRSVTTGIKSYSKSPQIIAEETFNLNPQDCKKTIVSDSVNQPLIPEEQNKYTKQPDSYYVHINPTEEVENSFKDTKKGIYYYRINSDLPTLRYYQRSILIGIQNTYQSSKE